jgi:2-polyprenyl-3-methyl-5-hydroxy-6-metoxy-1,4-benzoquinol methylase
MVGPYSVNQMDDFYAALSRGEVKPTGIMNYVQRLFIAERCPAGAAVVDVCCGRGLQLPVLISYAPHVGRYVGLDISPRNLDEAGHRIADLDHSMGRCFPIELIECDVAGQWPELAPFDVAVYTSALEHLPREHGVASLRNTSAALRPGGVMFLSTPNTPGPAPRPLQHRVHVYEWSSDELLPVLADCGFAVQDVVGLLPPVSADISEIISTAYGPAAARWYDRMRQVVPEPFLGPAVASALPAHAAEVLYVCTREQR